MAGKRHRGRGTATVSRSNGRGALRAMAEAGSNSYARARDLPKLLGLWPSELADESAGGSLAIIAKLRRALAAERRRALAGHWSYDLNRHLGLLGTYRGELQLLRRTKRVLNRTARAAVEPGATVEERDSTAGPGPR